MPEGAKNFEDLFEDYEGGCKLAQDPKNIFTPSDDTNNSTNDILDENK